MKNFHCKSLILTTVLLAIAFTAKSQDVKESDSYKLEKAVYQLGIKYGDINIARNAIYNLIALDPDDASLLDSLAFMYYEYQQHTSCLLVCLDILKRNPDHIAALEMSAFSYENLGLKDKALTAYERIYLKNNSSFTLYKVAILQFDLDRHGESMTNVDILLTREDTNETKIALNTKLGATQISLRAAIYNLKGLIQSEGGDKESAKSSFQEALALEPEFEMAKNNLAELDK